MIKEKYNGNKPNLDAVFSATFKHYNYNKSMFDGLEYDILHACHVRAGSKTNYKAIKKKYNCSKKIACILRDMPLLNVIVGSTKDNEYYKKNITYIDKKIINISLEVISDYLTDKDVKQLQNINIFCRFYNLINSNETNIINELLDIQNDFQRECQLL